MLLLDGKPVNTPARRAAGHAEPRLGRALAEEWDAQTDTIDAARMPLTRLANAAIDAVADNREAVADEVAKYLGSDLVCYRAEAPAGLVQRQTLAWDPVLDWARDALDAHFVQMQGVMFVEQPRQAIAAARGAIPADASDMKQIWRLAAVSR